MRRQQSIQILQYIVVWVLIYLFCVFVIKESFIDILLRYRLLFLLTSVSYFYYYSIQYEPDRKYELIRNVLIYGNVYLFAHVFFRPILNISHELFVFLWLILLWIRWTTKMKSRRKYLLQVVWLIFSFFILLSWVFYLYPDAPDVKWFIESMDYKIIMEWVSEEVKKSDAYIQIKWFKWNNDYEIIPNLTKKLTENCSISYPSIKNDRKEKLFIMTPEWRLFLVFPQSEVQLEFEWEKVVRFLKNGWKVATFSWIFIDDIKIVWDMENIEEEISDVRVLNEIYKYELVTYLKNQISESNISFANNTIMYDIDWKLLKFLAKMFPSSFWKNLRNYNSFMKYFSLVEKNDIDLSRYSQENRSWEWIFSLFLKLRKNFKIWVKNSYLLNRN